MDFNHMAPPKSITDPKASGGENEYPRYLYDAENSSVVVTSDDEKAARIKDGYSLKPRDLSRQSAKAPKSAA